MKVTALKPGYFGKLREPGDEFDVPDGQKASWFVPVAVVRQGADDPVGRQVRSRRTRPVKAEQALSQELSAELGEDLA